MSWVQAQAPSEGLDPIRTHWPWMSMTSVMSARSPLSIRRCRESVFPLAAGKRKGGATPLRMGSSSQGLSTSLRTA